MSNIEILGTNTAQHYVPVENSIVDDLPDNWAPRKLTAFNKTFFEVKVKRNNFIYAWVYILALPDDAENYYYHSCLENGSGEKILTFYGQARSLSENHDDIIKNEDCFVFGVITAKKHADKVTNQLQYNIKIRNIKDEAKDDSEESGIDD